MRSQVMTDEKQQSENRPEESDRYDRVSARQGEEQGIVRWILLLSLGLAVVALLVWLLFFV